MVQGWVIEQNFSSLYAVIVRSQYKANQPIKTRLFDNGEHPWFVAVIPICTHSQIYFLGIFISFVCGSEFEDATHQKILSERHTGTRTSYITYPEVRGERNPTYPLRIAF